MKEYSYEITCCSTADITKEHMDERNIKCIFFHCYLDGQHYLDDLGQTIPYAEFYQKLREGAEPKTSQINSEEFMDFWVPMLEAGKDVLHLSLSSGISGVYNSARIAAEELNERFGDHKVYVVDSLNASAGYGLLVDKIADKREEGLSAQEAANWAMENRSKLHAWFFTTDLTFFIKGGRVSKTAGIVGGMLNICPLLYIDQEGKLIPREKIRTKKKVIKAIVDKFFLYAKDGKEYSDKVYISHSDCFEDARATADLIEEQCSNLKEKISITYVGNNIGSHTGPGTVAMFFWSNQDVE